MKRIVMIGTSRTTMGGISSVVRTLEEGGLFSRCQITYIATHTDGSRGAKLFAAMQGWLAYMARLMTGRVGLLHVHLSSRASFWRKSFFILPSYLFKVPVVLHLHGGEFHLFYGQECSAPCRRFIRYVFERAARVVVLSKSWQAWVRDNFPRARVGLIYNPVSLPPIVHRESSPETVLFLGRLGERKGVYHLIAAAHALLRDYPRLVLWLGGDGEVEDGRALARQLGIEDHIEFLGWVSGEGKRSRLQQAAVYALPSYNEGLPMSVLEAMAYGLPVVATPVGGIPEAVSDGVEGFLVPPGDEAALADRLRRLLDDEELRRRMGAAARAKVERCFSTEVVVPQFEALYAELLGTK